ncbi:MAG: Pimeloyl-[acyl-carrier protein] methyl ester esterase, partial [Pseudomonadota bacterium]
RALAWDMPGYGDSALNGALSFAGLAQSLEQLLDKAQVPKAVLVGHKLLLKIAILLTKGWAAGSNDQAFNALRALRPGL